MDKQQRLVDISGISQDTAEGLCRIAKDYGITPGQIVEAFVEDLVAGFNGEGGNGADERELAYKYFDRNGNLSRGGSDFLRWLRNKELLGLYLESLECDAACRERQEEAESIGDKKKALYWRDAAHDEREIRRTDVENFGTDQPGKIRPGSFEEVFSYYDNAARKLKEEIDLLGASHDD